MIIVVGAGKEHFNCHFRRQFLVVKFKEGRNSATQTILGNLNDFVCLLLSITISQCSMITQPQIDNTINGIEEMFNLKDVAAMECVSSSNEVSPSHKLYFLGSSSPFHRPR